MANLPTQSFNTIVANTIAGIQGRAAKLINFSTGSTLRAIVEGFAGLFLWFQGMILKVLQATRLSTSVGADVDTFTADFMPTIGTSNGVASPRLGAQYATGQVTYARFTGAPSTCFIPAALSVNQDGTFVNAGKSNAATLQSADRLQNYVVIAAPSFATYSSALGGYTLNSTVTSIIVPVQALVPGAAGNVASQTITIMTTSVVGLDTVTNVAPLTNGADMESDTALKARFSEYILGLSRGDYFGLAASVNSVAVTVQWALTEGYNHDGTYHPGFFFVVADDGSGAPSQSFLSSVFDAANAVRPLGIQCAVFAPTVLIANISAQITSAPGYSHNQVVAAVTALLAFNVNSLGMGVGLPYSLIAAWIYSVPGVVSVQNILLNGLSGDAASMVTTRPSLDGVTQINYAVIKNGGPVIS